MSLCACLGPQNDEPLCPCLMEKVKDWHNAKLAACQRERDELRAKSSKVISGLVELLEFAGVFSDLDFNHNGRPAREVVSEILAAETADEMLAALHPGEATPFNPLDHEQSR